MRLAFLLALLAGTNIFASFLIHWYVLVKLGPGTETDSLYASSAVPQLVLAVALGPFLQVLTPLLTGQDKRSFSESAWSFLTLIGAIFAAMATLLSLLAPLWMPLLVPGFPLGGKSLAAKLAHIQLIAMVFSGLSGLLWATCNARGWFLWAAVAQPLGAIISLGILIVTLPRYGVAAAAWTSVFRATVQTIFLLPSMGSFTKVSWRSETMKAARSRTKPLFYGAIYSKTGPLVDRFLSSMQPAGGLSLLYAAQAMYGAVNDVINKAFTTPMVPLLAKHAKMLNWTDYQVVYHKRILWATALTFGGYVTLLVFGEPFFKLLIGHGGVTQDNVRLFWSLLIAMGGVLIGGAIGQISAAAFYSEGDTRTPTKVGMAGFTVGTVLKVIGFLQFGLIGIAIGGTFHQLFNTMALHLLMRKKLRKVSCAIISQ